MGEKEELLKVGKYNLRFNDILGIELKELDIFRSKVAFACGKTYALQMFKIY